MSKNSEFLVRPKLIKNTVHKRYTLFCFPYAGAGGSVFFRMLAHLDPAISPVLIQLPGRESRIHDLPYREMGPLVNDLSAALADEIDTPFICWGHSLGAVIAYEAIKKLQTIYQINARLFVASGRQAPHIPGMRFDKPLILMSDEELVNELLRFNLSEQTIYQNPDLRQLLLPRLRADFSLLEAYPSTNREKLNCPIMALHGASDPMLSLEESMAWAEYTDQGFSHEVISGSHFFIHEQPVTTMEKINRVVLDPSI